MSCPWFTARGMHDLARNDFAKLPSAFTNALYFRGRGRWELDIGIARECGFGHPFQIFFRGRRDLFEVIVIAVTAAAAHLGSVVFQQRHDRVIG